MKRAEGQATDAFYLGRRPNGDFFLTLICGERRPTVEMDAAAGYDLGLAILACTREDERKGQDVEALVAATARAPVAHGEAKCGPGRLRRR